jgi:hypothetical protein
VKIPKRESEVVLVGRTNNTIVKQKKVRQEDKSGLISKYMNKSWPFCLNNINVSFRSLILWFLV